MERSERGKEKKRARPISEDHEEEDHDSEFNTTRPRSRSRPRPRPRPRASSLLNGCFEAQSVMLQQILSPQQLATLENFIRSVVQEVVEIQVPSCIRSILSRNSQLCNDLTGKEALAGSGTLKFRLFFEKNQIASTIFTNNEIKAKDGTLLAVSICDTTNSNSIIGIGPLSSALVEIVVLDGEFGSGQRGDETSWSVDDFKNSIVSQREGKRPLIVGALKLYLENGVGFIKGLSFTDNSSWTKSKKFRFGVRIVDEKILTKFSRIGEGVSEPFRVMDHRGEVYKKHHPPKKGDKIWRLEGIGKDGTYDTRLSAVNIKTVDDFLKVYHEEGGAYLRKILGRVPKITWEKMVSNALECDDHVMAPLALDPNFGVHSAGNETTRGEALNDNFEVGDEPMNFGDDDTLSENIEDQKFDDKVQDLASFNPTSGQNLMDNNLEEGQQKSFSGGHGLSQTLFSAHEFGGHLQAPASYRPSFEQTLAENYEAMGLGGGLEGIEERECSNMFYDDYSSLLPHEEASIPCIHNHEVENATTSNQYYQERSWTELVPKPK
ncbi:calmodulin-binding protein 60 A-like isoform X2 [Momordica charantia]|uniref:Calmodulin-binding protein 60 A-like isoform X2 n=1 Tax=Momordica charantia TaxID=3673 RepID=A0A6J1DZI7_MOMCH|nr:calmodulin-binding protein 60 A-like isoform X2 [Momordica charantia]